jgi:hypothetical protein
MRPADSNGRRYHAKNAGDATHVAPPAFFARHDSRPALSDDFACVAEKS